MTAVSPVAGLRQSGWKDGEKKWPCAYEAVRNFHVNNETIGNMIAEVDLEGRPVDRVVEEWLWTRGTWREWTECARK
jgi:glycine betaine/proline transport system substrate-binding protein